MSVVILQDPAGYAQRAAALQAVHPRVYAVTPADKPNGHCRSFAAPESWLPTDPAIPLARRCWWKADAMGLAAVQSLGVTADFYWFIESDVVAEPARWRALFADFEADPSDLVAPMIRSRERRPSAYFWTLPSTPAWASHFMLMAIFRLSRAALAECLRCAGEMRECFAEVTIPSVIHRAGLSMTGLNARQTHCNTQTMVAHAERVILNPRLLNHPVKADSYAPRIAL